MATVNASGLQQTNDANLGLVRLFGICFGSLLFTYSMLGLRVFLQQGDFDTIHFALLAARLLLGAAGLVLLLYPVRLAGSLERQIDAMSSEFEIGYASLTTKQKICRIVLVTMVSLLLELVMIRWLASVFPVFSFFKNFTLLACFLGLGAEPEIHTGTAHPISWPMP